MRCCGSSSSHRTFCTLAPSDAAAKPTQDVIDADLALCLATAAQARLLHRSTLERVTSSILERRLDWVHGTRNLRGGASSASGREHDTHRRCQTCRPSCSSQAHPPARRGLGAPAAPSITQPYSRTGEREQNLVAYAGQRLRWVDYDRSRGVRLRGESHSAAACGHSLLRPTHTTAAQGQLPMSHSLSNNHDTATSPHPLLPLLLRIARNRVRWTLPLYIKSQRSGECRPPELLLQGSRNWSQKESVSG